MTVTLMGGPLDGMTMDNQPVTDDPGAYMIVPGELHRAIYDPEPDGPPDVWHYRGTIG
jgi:hypothetical protein